MKSKNLLTIVLLVLCCVGSANGAIVNTSVGTFDVTVMVGDFNSLSAVLMSQVWWNDSVLATEFAAAVQTALGLPHFGGQAGPYFAHTLGASSVTASVWCVNLVAGCTPPAAIDNAGVSISGGGISWAVAQRTNMPEGSTMGFMLLGLTPFVLRRMHTT